MVALTCRVAEGVISGVSIPQTLGLLWLATPIAPNALDPRAAQALGGYLLSGDMAPTAIFFAVGSTLFSYLLLRGRMIPAVLAWLGVIASVLLVVALPLEIAGVLHGPVTSLMYLPMLAFEVPVGFWLLIKGVRVPKAPAGSSRVS